MHIMQHHAGPNRGADTAISDLIDALNGRGIALTVDAGDLLVDYPAGGLAEDDLVAIREHKAELIHTLAAHPGGVNQENREVRKCSPGPKVPPPAEKPAPKPAPKAKASPPLADHPWPTAEAAFALSLKPEDIPLDLRLSPGRLVVAREKFLSRLQFDTRLGEASPRSRYGALQKGLKVLAGLLGMESRGNGGAVLHGAFDEGGPVSPSPVPVAPAS